MIVANTLFLNTFCVMFSFLNFYNFSMSAVARKQIIFLFRANYLIYT